MDNKSSNERLERIRARAHSLSAITCPGCSDWTHPLCWIAAELDAVLAGSAPETPAKPSMIKLLDQVRQRYREVSPGQCRILSNDDCRCFLCLTDSAMVLASQAERAVVKTTPDTRTTDS